MNAPTQYLQALVDFIKNRANCPTRIFRFQYLCPPPSNYETATGKVNLCNVKK
ncbi:MAG: hypothetical protein LBS01_09870 [Prevotellaceae bacterium]|nr:hypothetical protein [Prevotellaceae bacterium]